MALDKDTVARIARLARLKVPEEVKVRHPSLPWRQIADAGNKYRHEYEDVAERVVWATVQDALPSLLRAI